MENSKCKQRLLGSQGYTPKLFLIAFLLVMSPYLIAQTKTVSGTVLDDSREPVIGANVLVKGTNNGTITDIDGNFSISNVAENATLQISFLGYIPQEISVSGRTNFSITLMEDAKALDEVVVVGYGVVKKSDVTGAITSVSEKTLRERPVQNAVSAMQGKAAGVDIQTNVRPGEISKVVIRGTRSMKAQNDPLYIVDGIVLMGDMNDINPSDIASMEILKDAASTAIYGSRGANGVVLITTKSGKQGKISIEYNNTTSVDKINSITNWASAGEMLDRVRTAYINAGQYRQGTNTLTSPSLEADIEMFAHSDASTIAALQKAYEGGSYNSSRIPTTDWIDMVTRTGVTQNHQLALSSATETSRIYTSLGFYDAKGVQKNQDYKRYTARINAEVSPRKWINVGTTLNASYAEQSYGRVYNSAATGAKDVYGKALGQYLMAQPYDTDGELIDYPGNNNGAPVWNPLIDLENMEDLVKTINIQANAFADVKFTPWLTYRFNVGTGYRVKSDGRWEGSEATRNRQNAHTARASYYTETKAQWQIENILNFNKTFNKIHSLGATLVQSAQKYSFEESKLGATGILYDTSKWYNLAANDVGNPNEYSTDFKQNTLMSYMGRINYGLMDKYLLTASVRFDGASVLAPGHKWATFPSVALAWKIQEEEFMQSTSNWLDELKLRVGIGVTGNSAVDPYTTSGPLARYNYVWGSSAAVGMTPYDMPNPELGWEKTTQYNLGLDFGFLNRRLTGTIELYKSVTTDLIMERSIPGITGFVTILDNIGKIENKGIEINLTSVNIQKRDFRWTTDFNISHNKEEIKSLVNGKEDMLNKNWFIGYPINVFRYYQVDGFWQNTPEDLAEIAKWNENGYNFAPGQYKPVDQDNNYQLDDDDKVIVGNRNPKVVMGLTNTFNYKNWEFSFFLYGRFGQSYYANLTPSGYDGSGGYIGYGRKAKLSDFWSEDNPNAKYPQLHSNPASVSNADVNRAANIHNGSFLAVRNISLGYTLPERWMRPLTVTNCHLFAQVLNPFLFGGKVVKSGLNPEDTNNWSEMNSVGDPQGGTNNNTFVVTSMVFGIRLSF